jgi:hypothetical protein
MMSLRTALRLPKEHGAWAMLYVPFALGVLVAGSLSWGVWLLLLSITALFISRESLLVWWRARSRGRDAGTAGRMLAIYLGLAALCGAPLILIFRLFWLAPFALLGGVLLLINGKQATRLEERTVVGEMLAICGLTMTAPAAYYVARGVWENTALWLWALSALYFASSVFYVKLRVLSLHSRQPQARRRIWQHCAFYHSFLLASLLHLAFTGSLSLFALIAFAPALARTFWALLKPASRVNLTRAGVLEILYSLIFLVFITLTFHLA